MAPFRGQLIVKGISSTSGLSVHQCYKTFQYHRDLLYHCSRILGLDLQGNMKRVTRSENAVRNAKTHFGNVGIRANV